MVVLTKNTRGPTARWLQFEYISTAAGATQVQGSFLTDELSNHQGRFSLDAIPIMPATQSPTEVDWCIMDGTFEDTPVRGAYIAGLAKFAGKELWIGDSLTGWGRKLSSISAAEKTKLLKWEQLGTVRQDGSPPPVDERTLTFGRCKGEHWTLLLKILGISPGPTGTATVAEKKDLVRKFFTQQAGPADSILTIHGLPRSTPAAIKDRWWWKTKAPVVTDNSRWVWFCYTDTNENGVRPAAVVQATTNIHHQIKNWADNDAASPTIGITIDDTLLAGDVQALDILEVQNSQAYALAELTRHTQDAHDLFVKLQSDWDQPTRLTDYAEDTRQGDEKRMTIVMLASTIPILEDVILPSGEPAFDELINWFKKEAPALAYECGEAFRDVTTRLPGTPGAFRKEFLYIKNAALDGRAFYGDLIGNKLGNLWPTLGSTDDIQEGCEHPLLRNVIRMQDFKHKGNLRPAEPLQPLGGGSSDEFAKALAKVIGITTNEKFIDDDTWSKLTSGTLPACHIDSLYYHTVQLERNFPADHVARKVLAANGILQASDLTVPDFDAKSGAASTLYKIPEGQFKYRSNSSSAEKQQVMAFYHSLLALALNQPVGRFNKRFDFKGVEVRAINKCIRMVKNRIISDPDDPKLSPSEWFIYPSSSSIDATTIEATLFEKSLSTQLAQILACGGYFIGTDDMTAWKNAIKVQTDEPRISKIANDYRIKAHLLFWVALGFTDIESPAPSATQFVTYYITRAQSSYCIKLLCGSRATGDGAVKSSSKKSKRGKRSRAALSSDDEVAPPLKSNKKSKKRDEVHKVPDSVTLSDGKLPSPLGKASKSYDSNKGAVPWIWIQHVKRFPRAYGTTPGKLLSDPSISPRCPCGVGGGNHHNDGCISKLIVNKWSPNADLTATSTRAQISDALSKLKTSKGIKEKD